MLSSVPAANDDAEACYEESTATVRDSLCTTFSWSTFRAFSKFASRQPLRGCRHHDVGASRVQSDSVGEHWMMSSGRLHGEGKVGVDAVDCQGAQQDNYLHHDQRESH